MMSFARTKKYNLVQIRRKISVEFQEFLVSIRVGITTVVLQLGSVVLDLIMALVIGIRCDRMQFK